MLWLLVPSPGPARDFLRGDANDDGVLDISDAIFSLGYLFQGGGAPPCVDAADANDDGGLDVSDAIFSLGFLFRGEASPPPPHPTPGADPTSDELGCGDPSGTGVIRGQVLDDLGMPISGARVEARASGLVAASGDLGWYLLEDVPARGEILEFSRSGHVTVIRHVEVGDGDESCVHAVLTPVAAAVVVGPAGGVVTAADGTRVEILEGALMADTPITVTPLDTGSCSSMEPFGPRYLAGGAVDLGPNGLYLETPAIVTLPITFLEGVDPSLLSPGTEMEVTSLDPATLATTTTTATVDPGGLTATFEAAHFSEWKSRSLLTRFNVELDNHSWVFPPPMPVCNKPCYVDSVHCKKTLERSVEVSATAGFGMKGISAEVGIKAGQTVTTEIDFELGGGPDVWKEIHGQWWGRRITGEIQVWTINEGWLYAASYEISIPTAFKLLPPTEGPCKPRVKATSPTAAQTNVSTDSRIEITFDRPMDPASVEAAVEIHPPVSWSPGWNGGHSVLTMTPVPGLSPDTPYEVIIRPEAMSEEGLSMDEPYILTFHTVTAGGPAIDLTIVSIVSPGPERSAVEPTVPAILVRNSGVDPLPPVSVTCRAWLEGAPMYDGTVFTSELSPGATQTLTFPPIPPGPIGQVIHVVFEAPFPPDERPEDNLAEIDSTSAMP